MQAMDDGIVRAELNALFDELDLALHRLLTELERNLDSRLRAEPAPPPDGPGTRPMQQDNRRP